MSVSRTDIILGILRSISVQFVDAVTVLMSEFLPLALI